METEGRESTARRDGRGNGITGFFFPRVNIKRKRSAEGPTEEQPRDPQGVSSSQGRFINNSASKHKENPAEEHFGLYQMSDKKLRANVRKTISSSLSLETILNFSSCKLGRVISHFKEKQACVQSILSKLQYFV